MFLTNDVFVLAQGDTVFATVVPEVDERELEKMVNPIVQEYFEHGDTKEVQVSVLSVIKNRHSTGETLISSVNCIYRGLFCAPSPVSCCLRSSTWAHISTSSPPWPCPWPWKARPATES